MMICEDLVNLIDDDKITEKITDKNKINNKSIPVIDTIILDDEPTHNVTENNNIITIINDDVNSKSTNSLFTAISRENKLLGKFIEICLILENSTGMGRVINNTLIKNYMEMNKSYKNSAECLRVIKKAISSLETTPQLKFSHVKNLSETFKSKRFKKRVKLTTLVNLTEKPEITDFTKPKTIIIDSDEEQAPVINLDEDQNDVIILDTPMAMDEEKENKSQINTYLISQVEVTCEPNSFVSTVDTEQNVPEPLTAEMEKVKMIEKQIENYKDMINKLEEAEVDDDTKDSPYLKCERLKSKIVTLYSELCQLTGNEAVKRREVRLKVLEGHPAGPIKKLEKFINENIGSDGDPPFPDFNDVVNCVAASNTEDNMGWDRHQILKEARALFTQCGRALQKRRQKREWRDLLRRVKTQEADADPADQDPELLARLNENRRIAVNKENALLERYSHHNRHLSLINYTNKPEHLIQAIYEAKGKPVNNETAETNVTKELNIFDTEVKVKIENEPVDIISQLEQLGDNFTISVADIEDPFLVIEVSSDSEYEDDTKCDDDDIDI